MNTMHFVQIKQIFNKEGTSLPIVPMRIIRNAKDKEEALLKALRSVVDQYGEGVEFGPVFIAENGEAGINILEKGEFVYIYANNNLMFEVSHTAVIDVNPTIN